MIELYEFALSGNCHKVRLMLSLLGLNYQRVAVSGQEREHKSERFLALNPFGQVPVLKDGDTIIRDSQAILVYLARQYGDERWLPIEAAALAQVMSWLSTAANEVARGPNALRLHHKFGRALNLEEARQITTGLLSILQSRLEHHHWLTADHATVADIAVYPYIALAAKALPISSLLHRLSRPWWHRGVSPEERGSSSRRPSLPLNKFCWMSHCHGLFKTPVAA